MLRSFADASRSVTLVETPARLEGFHQPELSVGARDGNAHGSDCSRRSGSCPRADAGAPARCRVQTLGLTRLAGRRHQALDPQVHHHLAVHFVVVSDVEVEHGQFGSLSGTEQRDHGGGIGVRQRIIGAIAIVEGRFERGNQVRLGGLGPRRRPSSARLWRCRTMPTGRRQYVRRSRRRSVPADWL
jgi:hypothetical protein